MHLMTCRHERLIVYTRVAANDVRGLEQCTHLVHTGDASFSLYHHTLTTAPQRDMRVRYYRGAKRPATHVAVTPFGSITMS